MISLSFIYHKNKLSAVLNECTFKLDIEYYKLYRNETNQICRNKQYLIVYIPMDKKN